ncbi:MAG TPA: hypothetical protein VGW57_00205 [Chthoniobacterales bacterium]|nr:hypothetical protein [Chthoniobacterales bacterium]
MNQAEVTQTSSSSHRTIQSHPSSSRIYSVFVRLPVLLIFFVITCSAAYSQTPYPDWTIYGPAPVNNSTLTISASWSHAGAITSLKLGDVEFVDNADHGRQIQSSIQLNGVDPSYNPNEAGSIDDQDFPWSSSELLGLAIPSSNRLMTTTDMAYFFVKSSNLLSQPEKDHTVPESNAPPDGQLTQFWLQKDVTIAPSGVPGNVIEYLSTFQPSVVTPPAPVNSSIASSAGVYLKSDFSQAWTYDLATRTLLQHHDPNGADDMIKVMIRPSSPLGPLALSAYAPEHLQPYGSAASFGWWVDGSSPWPSTFLNPSHDASGGLPVSYRTYLVVGNPGEVTSSLDALGLKFSSEDPDVFNWREYIQLNPDFWPYHFTEADARNHWLNNGINEGRTASYHFALGRYRDLNSDQWGKTNQAVIDHYVQYGRKEGRTSVPRVDGGAQHTLVRSPQQDFVPVLSAGANGSGQLGDGTTNGTASPVRLPDFGNNSRVTEVAAGYFTSLAVLANGSVWMWGSNQYGARGDGSSGGQVNSPVQVPNLPPIVVPSTKDRHVVAVGATAYAVLDATGRVWTWGYGGNGQLGNSSENSRFTPGVVQKNGGGDLTDIVSIAVGDGNFMVALDIDEHVWTWGSNLYGQLGDNTWDNKYGAVKAVTYDGVTPLAGIVHVEAGGAFCVALDRSGEVLAWGHNGSGQLGNYGTAPQNRGGYCQIPGVAKPIDKIAAGGYHVLAHGHDDKVYVWGYNGYGQLGLSGVTSQTYPTPMPVSEATTNITDVAAGNCFSFLVRSRPYESDRRIFGLGDNQSGQLGIGNYTQQNQPVLTGF